MIPSSNQHNSATPLNSQRKLFKLTFLFGCLDLEADENAMHRCTTSWATELPQSQPRSQAVPWNLCTPRTHQVAGTSNNYVRQKAALSYIKKNPKEIHFNQKRKKRRFGLKQHQSSHEIRVDRTVSHWRVPRAPHPANYAFLSESRTVSKWIFFPMETYFSYMRKACNAKESLRNRLGSCLLNDEVIIIPSQR